MNGKPEGGMPPKVNIHRRIVSYGLLLVLAVFAFSLLVATRYQVSFFDKPAMVIRYDRWTGRASSAVQDGGGWKAF